METLYTHLTRFGLKKVIDQTEPEIVLQIIEIMKLPRTDPDVPDRFRVTLSDGFYKMKVVFGNDAGLRILQEKLQANAIIATEEILVSPSPTTGKAPLIIVMRFRTIFNKVEELVGEPISYCYGDQMDYRSGKGQTRIPNSVINSSSVRSSLQNSKSSYNSQRNGSFKAAPKNFKEDSLYSQSQCTNVTKSILPPANPTPNNSKSAGNEIHYYQISQLNSYQENVNVRARVLKKYGLRKFKSNSGEGQVFSCDVIDSNGTEIQVTLFNQMAIDFNEKLMEGQIYSFINGSVRPSNGAAYCKYDMKIILDQNCEVLEQAEDDSICHEKYKFVKLDKLKDLAAGCLVDILAIVQDVYPFVTVITKNGETKSKRNLMVFDDTCIATLWSNLAERSYHKGDILLLKDIKVHDYNHSRNLTNTFQTKVFLNPINLTETRILKKWFEDNPIGEDDLVMGCSETYTRPLGGGYTCVEQIECKAATIKSTSDRYYHDVVAYLYFIKHDMMYYISCPNDKCNRKVVEESGMYRCDACRNVFEKPKARYIINAKITDHSSTMWVMLNDNTGSNIIGKTADEIRHMRACGQEGMINETLKKATLREYKFRILTRIDSFNGEDKIKHFVVKVMRPNPLVDSKDIMFELKGYLEVGTKS